MEKQTQGLGLGGSREMGAALGLQAEPRARGGHTTWRLQGGMQAGCKNWL